MMAAFGFGSGGKAASSQLDGGSAAGARMANRTTTKSTVTRATDRGRAILLFLAKYRLIGKWARTTRGPAGA